MRNCISKVWRLAPLPFIVIALLLPSLALAQEEQKHSFNPESFPMPDALIALWVGYDRLDEVEYEDYFVAAEFDTSATMPTTDQVADVRAWMKEYLEAGTGSTQYAFGLFGTADPLEHSILVPGDSTLVRVKLPANVDSLLNDQLGESRQRNLSIAVQDEHDQRYTQRVFLGEPFRSEVIGERFVVVVAYKLTIVDAPWLDEQEVRGIAREEAQGLFDEMANTVAEPDTIGLGDALMLEPGARAFWFDGESKGIATVRLRYRTSWGGGVHAEYGREGGNTPGETWSLGADFRLAHGLEYVPIDSVKVGRIAVETEADSLVATNDGEQMDMEQAPADSVDVYYYTLYRTEETSILALQVTGVYYGVLLPDDHARTKFEGLSLSLYGAKRLAGFFWIWGELGGAYGRRSELLADNSIDRDEMFAASVAGGFTFRFGPKPGEGELR